MRKQDWSIGLLTNSDSRDSSKFILYRTQSALDSDLHQGYVFGLWTRIWWTRLQPSMGGGEGRGYYSTKGCNKSYEARQADFTLISLSRCKDQMRDKINDDLHIHHQSWRKRPVSQGIFLCNPGAVKWTPSHPPSILTETYQSNHITTMHLKPNLLSKLSCHRIWLLQFFIFIGGDPNLLHGSPSTPGPHPL